MISGVLNSLSVFASNSELLSAQTSTVTASFPVKNSSFIFWSFSVSV